MIRTILRLLVITVVLGSCKTTTLTSDPDGKVTARKLKKNYQANQLDYQWFSSKIKIDLDTDQLPIKNVTTSIRIRKDSAIWMSVYPLIGLEVLRVLITQDSLKVLDRMKNVYTAKSIQNISQLLPMAVSFEDVENMLVGQAIGLKGRIDVGTEDNLYKVDASRQGMQHILWLDPEFYTQKLLMSDEGGKNKMEVEFDKYKKVGRNKFPVERKMTIKSGEILAMQLKYSNIKVDQPQKLPFSVPSKYARN